MSLAFRDRLQQLIFLSIAMETRSNGNPSFFLLGPANETVDGSVSGYRRQGEKVGESVRWRGWEARRNNDISETLKRVF